jgi:hypothetical protein
MIVVIDVLEKLLRLFLETVANESVRGQFAFGCYRLLKVWFAQTL